MIKPCTNRLALDAKLRTPSVFAGIKTPHVSDKVLQAGWLVSQPQVLVAHVTYLGVAEFVNALTIAASLVAISAEACVLRDAIHRQLSKAFLMRPEGITRNSKHI